MAFIQEEFIPSEFNTKFERYYESLIYSLVCDYGIKKSDAENMTEYDYVFLTAIKLNQNKIQKYLLDSANKN